MFAMVDTTKKEGKKAKKVTLVDFKPTQSQ
jgi:hypothetical protein